MSKYLIKKEIIDFRYKKLKKAVAVKRSVVEGVLFYVNHL